MGLFRTITGLLVAGGLAAAQVPPPTNWNFQGRLTDSSGTPINAAQNMVFRFYDASAGATLLLTESQAGVPVNNGIYNYTFNTGTVTPGSEASYAAMFANQAVVWLEVEVATEVMTPRIQIVSAPYATNAGMLAGRPVTDFALASGTAATGPFSITESTASPSMLVDDSGGGPLLQLQNTGVDKFVVSGGGDVSASGFLNLVGLAAAPASATAGEGRMYYDSTLNRLRISGSALPYADVALDPQVVHLAQGIDNDASPVNPSIFINKIASGANLLQLQQGGADKFVVSEMGDLTLAGNTTLGDGGTDIVTFVASTVAIPPASVGALDIGGNLLHFDTQFNRIGIGTATPQRTLDVTGPEGSINFDVTTAGFLVIRGNKAGGNFDINNEGGGGGALLRMYGDQILFRTSGVPGGAMFIDNAGKVGIGTTTPSTALNVVSQSGPVAEFDSYGSGPIMKMRHANGTFAAPTALLAGDNLGTFSMSGYGATGFGNPGKASLKGIAAENWTDTAQGSHLILATTAIGSTTSFERLRITDFGNIGIGTASPTSPLHVVGDSGAVAEFDSYGSPPIVKMRFASGTIAAPLAVAANQNLGTFSMSGYGATGFGNPGKAWLKGVAAENWTDAAQGAYLVLGTTPVGTTASSERIRITDIGSIGIGMASPTSTLHVNGPVATAVNLQGGAYAVTAADSVIVYTGAVNDTITLPSAAGIQGRTIWIFNRASVGTPITVSSGSPIFGPTSPAQNTGVTYVSDGTNWLGF